MNEQPHPFPDDFRAWLAERGQDAYALVWVGEGSEPAGFEDSGAPRVGESGIARADADLTRIALHEVTHGRAETLRRWLQLDDGVRHLAVLTAELGVLREHTPGELAAELMRDPAGDEARFSEQLAGWFYRRNAEAQQGLELGWIAAAAAWACHMRALAGCPPPSVLTPSLQRAGELDDPTADLVVTTALKVVELIDRLELAYRTRTELVEDWHAVEPLAADVPALAPMAVWLLDQAALRDAHAQQLRAVLEPDLTDYVGDRRAGGTLLGTAPVLDEARTVHLAQAREAVRAYTAAAHSGREPDARQLLDAFPVPARARSRRSPPPRPTAASSRPSAPWRARPRRWRARSTTSSNSPSPPIAAPPQAPRATCSTALSAHWSTPGLPAPPSTRRTYAPACRKS
ncbi:MULTISPECIES: hypothetical protein [unclassified Streptomyces]|uniref:hypothetical protein n=1 Tax=unclassified Streptomyces TaxID=2593676 RepID=UPI000AC11CB9|nr:MULTISPECIES: hypothetical protein [unclassified Streptomyces]